LTEDRIKDGLINEFRHAVTKMVSKSYRVHFLCEVCGKKVSSGRQSDKEKASRWRRFKGLLSESEPDQDGYQLIITNQWVIDPKKV